MKSMCWQNDDSHAIPLKKSKRAKYQLAEAMFGYEQCINELKPAWQT
jgi:hypothetical protein